MVNYSKVEKVFRVTEFIRTKSCQRVRLDYAVRFPGRDPPSTTVIQFNYKKFQENGTILNRNKNNSGRLGEQQFELN